MVMNSMDVAGQDINDEMPAGKRHCAEIHNLPDSTARNSPSPSDSRNVDVCPRSIKRSSGRWSSTRNMMWRLEKVLQTKQWQYLDKNCIRLRRSEEHEVVR
ncbi:hypothetical protein RvY_01545-2 [Ramazzottius varieornatus]|uniref:Uncharacterized protein n=1 Tax=Ramazzottius varieornatus TaxID=947166 RepID=A0A1D1UMR0_RAMVA|nr:hypothetical protein RvY_01545-2 [Ramazzottius varieornatus]